MTGSLIAFGFYTPWMLAGVLLASLPILIHYWYRRNYQVTEWAAIQFLLSAVEKHSRRIKLEQLILLSIRFLILALIAFAMAEPYLSGGQKAVRSTGSVHRLLVMDASYSMGKRDFKETQFEKAKSIAQEIVKNSARGDFLSLYRVSSVSQAGIIPEPTLYHNTIVRELDQMELTFEPGNLTATIEAIRKSLADHSQTGTCEVIFLTDMQKLLWNPIPDARLQELDQQLNGLGQSCAIRIIDVGDEKISNLAVTSLKLEDSFLVVDRPASFKAEIQNFGYQPIEGQLVELYVNGHLADTTQIDIAAGQIQVASFTHLFAIQGKHHLEVRMTDDALPVDQNRWLSVKVQKALKVLLVNGRKADDPANQPSFYLQTVLSPKVTSGKNRGIFDVDFVQISEWDQVDLKQYDSVFLVDLPDFQEAESQKLRQYLSGGGGIVLCMGNQVDIPNYNQWSLNTDHGFLPVELIKQAKSNRTDQAFRFTPEDLSHPILKPFEGNPGTGLESTVVLNYMKVKPLFEYSTIIPLRYDSGDPVITETSFEKGKIIVITTSADVSWGTWAVQPSFPPMIYELAKHVVSGRWNTRDLKPGMMVQIRFPELKEGTPVSVVLPDGGKKSVVLSDIQEQTGLVFSEMEQAGVYKIELGESKNLLGQFAVNLDTTESDLKRIPFEMISHRLSEETDLSYSKEWNPDEGTLSGTVELKTGITRGLIILVLCLFFVELVMSWKFSYGLGLLTLSGLLAGIFSVAKFQPILGWGVFVIAIMVILFLGRNRFKMFARSKN